MLMEKYEHVLPIRRGEHDVRVILVIDAQNVRPNTAR